MYFIDYSLGSVIKLQSSFYLVLFYVVFFPGLISFLFWIKGVKLIGANRSGVFLHLMPILGAIMAMIIFKEKILFYHFLGAIFIIAGITISNKKTQNA
jgi:drug/metabolite transporter (DMT)-like permease